MGEHNGSGQHLSIQLHTGRTVCCTVCICLRLSLSMFCVEALNFTIYYSTVCTVVAGKKKITPPPKTNTLVSSVKKGMLMFIRETHRNNKEKKKTQVFLVFASIHFPPPAENGTKNGNKRDKLEPNNGRALQKTVRSLNNQPKTHDFLAPL